MYCGGIVAEERKTFKTILIILLAIILGAGAGAGYYYYLKLNSEKQSLQAENSTLNAQLEAKNKDCPTQTTKPKAASETCASTLIATEKEEIALWKTYTNTTFNFSFKYPETWQIEKEETNAVTLLDTETDLHLVFYANYAPEPTADSYTASPESATSTKVACASTTKQSLFGPNNYQKLYTKFVKNETTYAIVITFQNDGASISGDIADAYSLLLKTVE